MICMRRASQQRGFTLLELMAVVFLIGVVVAVATVSVGSGSRAQQVHASARYLYNAMALALEEAIVTQSQIGVRFDVDGMAGEQVYRYQWLVYDAAARQWRELPADVIEAQPLPEQLELLVEVDGQPLIVGGEQKKDLLAGGEKQATGDKEKTLQPDVYFLSSGEMPAFSLTLQDTLSDARYTITGNLLGQLQLVLPNEQQD